MRQWLCALALLVLLAGCERAPEVHKLAGKAMGTQWHVSYVDASNRQSAEQLTAGIAAALERVEASMSTYRDSSAISRFNALPPNTSFSTDPDFSAVLTAALDVGAKSGGAFDVTVGPLVELWGFGAAGRRDSIPDEQAIAQAHEAIGVDKLQWNANTGELSKSSALRLDFSALAKGYGVDEVADWLLAQGVSDFLVEVGGELRVSGEKPHGQSWRIAIEQPDATVGSIAATLPLHDQAVATSGDYRNYFEVDGKRYSHTIDPRTGYPVTHDLVSVTVIHPTAMLADAWATALSVVGAEQALALARRYDLAVYLIQRQGEQFIAQSSPAFARFPVDDATAKEH